MCMETSTQIYAGEKLWRARHEALPNPDSFYSGFGYSVYSAPSFCADLTRPELQTVSSILSFFLIMAQHPAIQQRAQDEVDAVIRKQGRPPKCCDRQCMPYLDAVLKEVHRCNPVAPLGEA